MGNRKAAASRDNAWARLLGALAVRPRSLIVPIGRDMRAFHREKNPIKADEIVARQLHALRQYQRPHGKKLRLSDVKRLFELMRVRK